MSAKLTFSSATPAEMPHNLWHLHRNGKMANTALPKSSGMHPTFWASKSWFRVVQNSQTKDTFLAYPLCETEWIWAPGKRISRGSAQSAACRAYGCYPEHRNFAVFFGGGSDPK